MPSTPTETETVSAGFGKRTSNSELIALPSGARVRCRRPGLQVLLKEGIIDQFDTLTGIVENETIPKAKGVPAKLSKDAAKKLTSDPTQINKLLETVDKITVNVVVEPRILPEPTQADLDRWNTEHPDDQRSEPDELRDDEQSYVDYVDFEDKLFIMNFAVGGSRDLERFRQESQAALGLLHDGEADGDQTA